MNFNQRECFCIREYLCLSVASSALIRGLLILVNDVTT
jgi:hypothetical protein